MNHKAFGIGFIYIVLEACAPPLTPYLASSSEVVAGLTTSVEMESRSDDRTPGGATQ